MDYCLPRAKNPLILGVSGETSSCILFTSRDAFVDDPDVPTLECIVRKYYLMGKKIANVAVADESNGK